MEREIVPYILNNRLVILARPNSSKTEIVGWDEDNAALRVNIHARPEGNEANMEIIKFFSRILKKRVKIQSGLTSRKKILLVVDR